MKNLYLIALATIFLSPSVGFGQAILPLWPDGVPNQNPSEEVENKMYRDILRISNVQNPTLEVFLPAKKTATGQAVVICPGGGYSILAYDWEGIDIAKWYNAQGIAAVVLKYRLPKSSSLVKPEIAPLQDAQRAIRLVRHHAKKWNVDSDQIGVMGFSAGGHLASTLGTHYDENYYHGGSKNNLIGKNASQELIDHYSNDLQVSSQTPTTFLLHTTDDKAVPVENSLLFYQALERNGVAVEMHIYPEGGHGFGLGIGHGHLQQWPDRLKQWLSYIKVGQ
jgi:acetyl esterase/lipase